MASSSPRKKKSKTILSFFAKVEQSLTDKDREGEASTLNDCDQVHSVQDNPESKTTETVAPKTHSVTGRKFQDRWLREYTYR